MGKRMKKPTIEEIQEYCQQRNNGIDGEAFWHYYEANGWVQGKCKKPVKSWKSCVITWEKSRPKKQSIVQKWQDTSWAN